MKGRHPKPAAIRQNRTKKVGRAELDPGSGVGAEVPPIPNPDGREWHPLTIGSWARAWTSPMAAHWLESDGDALGRLAVCWDNFNKTGDAKILAEIRLQESRFGFSPLDRSRLQWEMARTDEAETKQNRRAEVQRKRTGTNDPRHILTMVKHNG